MTNDELRPQRDEITFETIATQTPASLSPWDELKHAIRVYHTLTQGPSPALCLRLMKLPDFIDDIRAGQNCDTEMVELAYILTREVGEGVRLKLETYRNQPGLAETVRGMRSCLQSADAAAPLEAKRMILLGVESALLAMENITNEKYPKVPI